MLDILQVNPDSLRYNMAYMKEEELHNPELNHWMDRLRWEVQRQQQFSGWVVRQLDQDSETEQSQEGKNRTKRQTLEGDEIAERKRYYNKTYPKRRLSWERSGSENPKNFLETLDILQSMKKLKKTTKKATTNQHHYLIMVNYRHWNVYDEWLKAIMAFDFIQMIKEPA